MALNASRRMRGFLQEAREWAADPRIRKRMHDQSVAEIEGWLAGSRQDPVLNLSLPIGKLASWHAGVGSGAVLTGVDGWAALETGLALRTIWARILVSRFDNDARKRRPHAFIAGEACLLWAWAMSWDASGFSQWLGERISSAPETGVFTGFDGPVETFVLDLVRLRRRESPLGDASGPYGELISSLSRGDAPSESTLSDACDEHLRNVRSGSPLYRFPYDLLPAELLAYVRVGAKLGVAVQLPDHPLVTTPLCAPHRVSVEGVPYWNELTRALDLPTTVDGWVAQGTRPVTSPSTETTSEVPRERTPRITKHRTPGRHPGPTWSEATDDLDVTSLDDLDYDTPCIPGTVVGELVDLLIADGSDVGAAGDRSLGELIDTLHDSGRGLVVDWRAQLAEVLEAMRTQLSLLGVQMDYSPSSDGCAASVRCNGSTADVKYRPSDEDDFDLVVSRVNELTRGRAEYRRLRCSLGSDTWEYVLATPTAWSGIHTRYPRLAEALFVALG